MRHLSVLAWITLAWTACFSDATTYPSEKLRHPIKPNEESAKANAFHIFNAIHSAGRQWGASIYHNGFGFFPAVMPKGTQLYHGSRHDHPPPGPEWLALETEHAAIFSDSRRQSVRRRCESLIMRQNDGQHRSGAGESQGRLGPPSSRTEKGDDDLMGNCRGFLQTHITTRDLHLLYIDGMAAAKSDYGTLDSQDILLRENATVPWDHYMGELERAQDICDIITDWGYDGFMRVEIGFEVVQCNFTRGLRLVGATRSFMPIDRLVRDRLPLFQFARAVSREYDGIPGLVRLDFSAMVSGFFFPINVSHTDPARPDLIRLAAAKLDDLRDIKHTLRRVSEKARSFAVNWQIAVDLIVARFAESLALMTLDRLSPGNFVQDLESLILAYVDAPASPDDMDPWTVEKRTSEAIERCEGHFLTPARALKADWSESDQLIHAAIDTVAKDICRSLFAVRTILLSASEKLDRPQHPDVMMGDRIRLGTQDDGNLGFAIGQGKELLRALMRRLAWTEWRRTRPCPVDEVWFVAMYPFGTDEDYWNPGCRKIEEMNIGRIGYWPLQYFKPNETKPKRFPQRSDI